MFNQRHNAFTIYYMIYYPMRPYTELGMIESNFKKEMSLYWFPVYAS